MIADIPVTGVRLDDLTISRVIELFKASILHKNWPADFDKNGMVRATRVPLGHAAKVWIEEGEQDVDGEVVEAGQAGFYYRWWRGIYCLVDEEGMAEEMYPVRPSHEAFWCPSFSFRRSYKAVIQSDGGHI